MNQFVNKFKFMLLDIFTKGMIFRAYDTKNVG